MTWEGKENSRVLCTPTVGTSYATFRLCPRTMHKNVSTTAYLATVSCLSLRVPIWKKTSNESHHQDEPESGLIICHLRANNHFLNCSEIVVILPILQGLLQADPVDTLHATGGIFYVYWSNTALQYTCSPCMGNTWIPWIREFLS